MVTEGLMLLLKRYSPIDLLSTFRQLDIEAGKPVSLSVSS
jgi:hypothetical protein